MNISLGFIKKAMIVSPLALLLLTACPGDKTTDKTRSWKYIQVKNIQYKCWSDCSECFDMSGRPINKSTTPTGGDVYRQCENTPAEKPIVTPPDDPPNSGANDACFWEVNPDFEVKLDMVPDASINIGFDEITYVASTTLPVDLMPGDKVILEPKLPNEEKFTIVERLSSNRLKVKEKATKYHSMVVSELYTINSNNYGYDSWRDKNNFDHINHVSLSAPGFTSVKVTIDEAIIKAYSQNGVYALLPIGGNFSFSSDNTIIEKKLDGGDNYLRIYGKFTMDIEGEMTIEARSGDNKKELLAGFGRDEKGLTIHKYKQKEFTDYKLYVLGSGTYNPTEEDFIKEHNKFVKQGVLKINSVVKKVETDISSWDINNNKKLDVLVSFAGVPLEMNEWYKMVEHIKEFTGGCVDDKYGATIIVPDEINEHYYLSANAKAGDVYIKLNSVEGLAVNMEIYIGPWLGGTGDYEWVKITYVDKVNNEIEVKQLTNPNGLAKDHPKGHTFYVTNTIGVTFSSCSCVQTKNITYRVMTHEFLHQDFVGDLQHVKETDNIMYPYVSGAVGSKLRARSVDLYEGSGSEEQWDKLH